MLSFLKTRVEDLARRRDLPEGRDIFKMVPRRRSAGRRR